MRITNIALALGAALFLSTALAGGPKSVKVSIEADGRYSVDAYRFGKAELVGYLGDRKDEAGVEAVVFKGVNATNEPALIKLAGSAGLKAFADEGGKLRELTAEGGGSAATETAERQ
jgi:hypothetical protein